MWFIIGIIVIAIIQYGFRSRCPSCGSWFAAKHLGGKILHSFTDYRTVRRDDRDVQEAYAKHQIEHSYGCTKCNYVWEKIVTDTSVGNPLFRSGILRLAIVLVILISLVMIFGKNTPAKNTEETTQVTKEDTIKDVTNKPHKKKIVSDSVKKHSENYAEQKEIPEVNPGQDTPKINEANLDQDIHKTNNAQSAQDELDKELEQL